MIDTQNFTPLASLVGGAMIGAASALALFLTGKIPGISGIVGRLLRLTSGDILWRVTFVVGLVLGGALVPRIWPQTATYVPVGDIWVVGLAGLLVGLGTRIGGGCTSGHGVCGIGEGSGRSLVATVVFMLTAGAVVFAAGLVTGSP